MIKIQFTKVFFVKTLLFLLSLFSLIECKAAEKNVVERSKEKKIKVSATQLSSSRDSISDTSEVLRQLKDKVYSHKLSNGIKVTLYKRGFAPVFAGVTAIRAGGTDEKEGYTGVAHFLEHMAFKGTKDIGTKDYLREKILLDKLEAIYTKYGIENIPEKVTDEVKNEIEAINNELKTLWIQEDLSRQFEKRGASGLNATTDKEITKYFVNLPRSAFEFWCQLESERLFEPVMRQFYSEKEVVFEERRMRFVDDPTGKLYEMLLAKAYKVHPYKNPVIGYDQDLKRITATDLLNFHKQYYVPSNIAISLVGDVDPKRDIPVLEQYFGKYRDSESQQAVSHDRNLPQEPVQVEGRRVVLKDPSAPVILVAYHKPSYPDPRDPAISVMNEILAGSRTSPLYKELVEKRKIAASVDVEEAPGIGYPNLTLFSIVPKTGFSNAEVLKAFDDVIERFKKNVVDTNDLIKAKRSIAVSYLDDLNSNSSLATHFSVADLIFGSWTAPIDWYIQAMSVEKKAIQSEAVAILKNTNRTVAWIENENTSNRKASSK
jgi:predicted Zn-dependent peptidase